MKRIICITLIISLLICPVFAFADTEQTLVMMNDAGIAPIQAAAAADTNVWLNGFNIPSSMSLYYFGSGGSVATGSYPNGFSQLPGLFNGITYSIAYSISNLSSRLVNTLNTINTNIDGLESSSSAAAGSLSNLYSRLATTNSYIDGIEGYIDQIESYVDGVESSLSGILTAIQNQSLTIPQSLLDDVDHIDSTVSAFSPLSYNSSALARYRQQFDGGSSLDLTVDLSARNSISNIWYFLANLNQSSVFAFRDLVGSVGSPATGFDWLDKDLNSTNLGRTSLWRDFRTLGVNINNIVARLGFVLANDEDIAARQAAAATTEAAIDDFISGSGNASVSAGDLGSLASFTKSVTSSSAAPVDPSMIIQSIDSSSPWIWFTNDVLFSLEPTSAQRGQAKYSSSTSADTPLLDSNLIDIQKALGLYDDR